MEFKSFKFIVMIVQQIDYHLLIHGKLTYNKQIAVLNYYCSFNQLDLPVYETSEKLRTYLLKAIHECSEGFGFA